MNSALLLLSKYSMQSFFREFEIVHENRIPMTGATLVYTNHSMFMADAFSTLFFKRHMTVVGQNQCGSIPFGSYDVLDSISTCQTLERKNTSKGSILEITENTVYGFETQFTTIQKGQTILLPNGRQYKVEQINSDNQLTIVEWVDPNQRVFDSPFEVVPSISEQAFIQEVSQRLKNGDCIFVFAESHSHDTQELLPLKTDTAKILLGVIEKYNVPVSVVPMVINNYRDAEYRTKFLAEVGQPFHVSEQMLNLYKTNQRAGIDQLTLELREKLVAIKADMRSEPTLDKAITLRKMIAAEKGFNIIKTAEKLIWNRQSAQIINKFRQDKAENIQPFDTLDLLNQTLVDWRLDITELNRNSSSKSIEIFKLISNSLKVIIKGIICMPGLVMYGPSAILSSLLARYQQKVITEKRHWKKVPGAHKDVIGSLKLLYFTLLAPLATLINFGVIALGSRSMKKQTLFKLMFTLMVLLPIYHEFFKLIYDSMGRDYKQAKHSFVKMFNSGLMTKIQKQHQKIMTYVKPLI